MSQGDEPRDPRQTLTELERRLLELERELRASGDLPAGPPPGAQEQPAPPPPAPTAPEPAVASGFTPPAAPASASASPPGTAEPAPLPQPGTPTSPPGRADVPIELDVLVEEARVRANALRTSLDSLLGVNDHLRQTAGDVIADHGEALTQLDRALAGHGLEGASMPAPLPGLAPVAAAAPPLVGVPRGEPVWEQPAPAAPHRRRRRWLIALLLLLLLGALAAAAYVIRERRRDTPPAPAATTPTTVAVTVPSAMQIGIVGARRFAPSAGPPAVCSGIAAAAIVDTPGQPACPQAVVVARVTDTAFGLVSPRRKGGRGRRCISLVTGGDLAPHNDSARLNDLRARALDRARRAALTAAHRDGLKPAQAVRAGSTAASSAARAFDAKRGLHALAVSKRAGAACIRPTAANLFSGRYPLAHQLTVLAPADAQASTAVTGAVASLQSAYGGPVVLDAHVLR